MADRYLVRHNTPAFFQIYFIDIANTDKIWYTTIYDKNRKFPKGSVVCEEKTAKSQILMRSEKSLTHVKFSVLGLPTAIFPILYP